MNKELYNEWITIADIDYATAKKMYDEHWHQQHYIICYLSQQAAEKYLKGYIVYHNEEIEKIHVLEKLLITCSKYADDFNTLKKECIYLTQFAVEVRYPDTHLDITEVESKKALEYAKTIIDFVKEKIRQIDI